MPGLQNAIHHWDEGSGARLLRWLLLLLSALALAFLYDVRAYRNFSTVEAMDHAQVARNLAEGRGFVTQFIRPFSVYLLQKHANNLWQQEVAHYPSDQSVWTPAQKARAEEIIGKAVLTGAHPDISNPPGYPAVLAGLMLVAPFHFDLAAGVPHPFYQPELIITLFNQLLFFFALWLVFSLARRFFDQEVAWFSVIAMLGAEILWRFTMSGLSTMLLIVIFLGVVWCLVWLERGAEEFSNLWKLLPIAALLGLLLAAGALTRYSFAGLVGPAVVFMGLYLGAKRLPLCLTMLFFFAAGLTPWLLRNYELTGTPFGTAGYAWHELTFSFPDTRLPRSLEPNFNEFNVQPSEIPLKLSTHIKTIITSDLPRLGGSWITAFFLAGLLVPFKNPTISRLRWFVLMALGVLAVTQAIGRTHLSVDSPDINSENLLVVLAPMVFLLGAAMFFTLLDQARIAIWEVRPLFIGGYVVVASLPLLTALLPPTPSRYAYPPYEPALNQEVGKFMKEDELMMTDIPWAVAWYGHRPAIWLTLNSDEDFKRVYQQRPVKALYFTQVTLDARVLSQWRRGDNEGWGGFLTACLFDKHEVPDGFPLKQAWLDLFPEQFVLTDRVRWQTGSPGK